MVAALILFTRKPGGGIWVYVNYWGLNNVIVKNYYFILLIREILNMLSKAKYFTKLDIIVVFN